MENKSSKEEKESIPTIDLKLETKEIKGGMIYCPYILIETPYMIISDMNGSRKVWTKNKKKIILYYLYRITKIEWFIRQYNKLPR